MVKLAQFYLIEQPAENAGNTQLSVTESLACELAASYWRKGNKILIACETEAQANNIDEALWQRDPNEFVPHNLSGEFTAYPTPIEISWHQKRNANSRDILISLQNDVADYAATFTKVIDFVPHDEEQKKLARERYKIYRQLGFEMKMEKI